MDLKLATESVPHNTKDPTPKADLFADSNLKPNTLYHSNPVSPRDTSSYCVDAVATLSVYSYVLTY